jgi:hypothetical protein
VIATVELREKERYSLSPQYSVIEFVVVDFPEIAGPQQALFQYNPASQKILLFRHCAQYSSISAPHK